MEILRYKYYQIGKAGGVWTHGTVKDLLLAMPYLIDHFVPPLDILNDLLQHGQPSPVFPHGLPDGTVQYDAGMSGGCVWRPFQITQQEYEELVLDLVTSPGLTVQAATPAVAVTDIAEWQQWTLTAESN